MDARIASSTAGGLVPPASVPVWDRFVRVFHWTLVAAFAAAYLSGDEIEGLHLAAGYAIAVLVGLRVLWGFIGSRHARFTDFVRGPAAVRVYLRQMLALSAPRHLGHNPAGGAMVLAMLGLLATLCGSGILMTSRTFWGSALLEGIHEAAATGMLVLIALHVGGVLFASLEHGESLVRAMWTGKKRAPD